MTAMNHHAIRYGYATYKIAADFNPGTFFVGCCPLASLSTMPDAWTYQTFVDQIKDGRAAITMTVIGIYTTREEAEAVQHTTAAIEKVWCNLHSERCEQPRNVGRASLGTVVNTATGVRYDSAAKAAKAIGITSAAMSLHLNGKLTHVKGQRFERVSTDA